MSKLTTNNSDRIEPIYEEIDDDFYDAQANSPNPLRSWFHTNRFKIVNQLVKSKFKKGMKILDLGCGSCNWNTERLEVFGVDLNEGLLKHAKLDRRLSDYKVGDILTTGFASQSFDIIVASDVLEHFHRYNDLIKEINRILRPGGFAIVSVPFDTYYGLWKYLFFVQVVYRGYILGDQYYKRNCGHVNSFSPDSIKSAFLRNDFEIDSIFDMRRFIIFLVARKK